MHDASGGRLTTMRILWGSLVASTVLLLVLSKVTEAEHRGPGLDAVSTAALSVVAVILFVLSLVMPPAMRRSLLAEASFAAVERPARQAPSDGRCRATPTLERRFADQAAILPIAWGGYQTTLILGMALAEGVALLGFVQVFLGRPFWVCLPFFVLAWSSMLNKLPTMSAFLGPLEAVTGARWTY